MASSGYSSGGGGGAAAADPLVPADGTQNITGNLEVGSGDLVLAAPDVTIDNGINPSTKSIWRGAYDSEGGPGVTSSDFDWEAQNVMIDNSPAESELVWSANGSQFMKWISASQAFVMKQAATDPQILLQNAAGSTRLALFGSGTNGFIDATLSALFLRHANNGNVSFFELGSGAHLSISQGGNTLGAQFNSNDPDSASAVGFTHKTTALDATSFTAGALHSKWTDTNNIDVMTLGAGGTLTVHTNAINTSFLQFKNWTGVTMLDCNNITGGQFSFRGTDGQSKFRIDQGTAGGGRTVWGNSAGSITFGIDIYGGPQGNGINLTGASGSQFVFISSHNNIATEIGYTFDTSTNLTNAFHTQWKDDGVVFMELDTRTTGKLLLTAPDATDNAVVNSPDIVLQANYDSDSGAGVTPTDYNAVLRHTMNTTAPFSQVDLSFPSGINYFFNSLGEIGQDTSVTLQAKAGFAIIDATSGILFRVSSSTFMQLQTIGAGPSVQFIAQGRRFNHTSQLADSASAVDHLFNSTISKTTAGALLMRVDNFVIPVFWVDKDGGITVKGDLDHDGTNVGFYGTAPVPQAAAYTPTNVVADRAYDANATSLDELADVLGTLISDLQATGLIG